MKAVMRVPVSRILQRVRGPSRGLYRAAHALRCPLSAAAQTVGDSSSYSTAQTVGDASSYSTAFPVTASLTVGAVGLAAFVGTTPFVCCAGGPDEASASASTGQPTAAVSRAEPASASAYSAEDSAASLFTGFSFSPLGNPVSAHLLKQNFIACTTERLPGMRREIQAVALGRSAGIDNTWRIATRSGQGKKGTLTTVTNEIGECAAASFHYRGPALVGAARERRPAGVFSPKVVFVDDMPNNHAKMQEIFGVAADHVIQDLRHLQNRITSTFISSCKLNAQANAEVRDIFTRDIDNGELRKKIIRGLQDATLPGKVLGTTQSKRQAMQAEERKAWVEGIIQDGRFHKAFATNLERVMRPVEEIKDLLKKFCGEYEFREDEDGRRLFSSKTKKAIEEQERSKVQFLTEPTRMYIDKGTDSRGLRVVQSFRGTNLTETWHNNVVDFVTGESTGAALANLLLHAGTVRWNANRRRAHGREDNTHHYNREGCIKVNEHLVRAGQRKRYRFEELAPDNGERFFNDKRARAGTGAAASATAAAPAAQASDTFAPPPRKRAKSAWDKKMEHCSGPPVCYAHYVDRTMVKRITRGRPHHDKRCIFHKFK